MMKKLTLIIAFLFALSSMAFAYIGKLDAYGGQYNKSKGKYHVYEGQLAGMTYKNQENAQGAGKYPWWPRYHQKGTTAERQVGRTIANSSSVWHNITGSI